MNVKLIISIVLETNANWISDSEKVHCEFEWLEGMWGLGVTILGVMFYLIRRDPAVNILMLVLFSLL